ncbi:MAG: hypothetical protein GOV15_00720, partial [Candidatus Diapherotrites archaeon]|nr:hypothetical protein [Candidatus Diapherotrites archaeon]
YSLICTYHSACFERPIVLEYNKEAIDSIKDHITDEEKELFKQAIFKFAKEDDDHPLTEDDDPGLQRSKKWFYASDPTKINVLFLPSGDQILRNIKKVEPYFQECWKPIEQRLGEKMPTQQEIDEYSEKAVLEVNKETDSNLKVPDHVEFHLVVGLSPMSYGSDPLTYFVGQVSNFLRRDGAYKNTLIHEMFGHHAVMSYRDKLKAALENDNSYPAEEGFVKLMTEIIEPRLEGAEERESAPDYMLEKERIAWNVFLKHWSEKKPRQFQDWYLN